MLKVIYRNTVQLIENHLFNKHPYLKDKYLQFAMFCSNHGICPPLSPRPDNVERGWMRQSINDPHRNPYLYIEYDDSITLMFQDTLPFLDKNANILEIGCNAGRNLDYLYSKGYRRLTGIEIGIEPEEVMKKTFPDAYNVTTYIVGNAYEEILKLPSSCYDLVFCHSVLVNIAPRWNAIFKEMARVSKSYILIMESEGSYNSYPRNFEKMFRKANYRQILYKLYRLSDEKRILAPNFSRQDKFHNNTIRLFVPIKR